MENVNKLSPEEGARVKNSKLLSLVLRHKPEMIDLSLDSHGWALVNDIVNSKLGFTKEDLTVIILSCKKGRFELSDDNIKVRAKYGHTFSVDVGVDSTEPPEILYHGTAMRFVPSIKEQGLKHMKRNYVHLSNATDMARSVGGRHGIPVLLKVRARDMFNDGHPFYSKGEHVWLTDDIPMEYIEEM